MPRRTLIVVLGLLLIIVGGYAGWRLTPRAPEPPPPEVARAPRPSAAPVAPAPATAPPAAPESEPARRSRPAAPEPTAPAPEPEPVAAAPTVGVLRIDSDIAGAQVFIDRNYVGITPVTAPDVAPGMHRFNIVAKGHESIAENIEVTPGPRDLQFNFKEVKLDAAIDVVHKHRMGSCKGKLVATPSGIRYETTDKDDAFAFALTDLDLFEVDYLAKELRVKTKKSRRFEFTDTAAANADRLFVFHRDVDKARKKILESQ